ncbi:MAG: YhfX family PLP-dependent enzyme [Chloroflexi bacterium]|nr:YhfX family PLP-dependent enzyme [Chloroflexota bacterium]
MFLNPLVRRNRPFIEVAVNLHQAGKIPANSYVLDLDMMQANARIMTDEANRLGLKIYAMSKQFGRNTPAFHALAAGGIDAYVAVDLAGARVIHAAGFEVGHIGHLVQIPQAEALTAAKTKPTYWTVFSQEKAQEAAEASGKAGHTQRILARIYAGGDTFYMGHEGGFKAADVVAVADTLDALPNAEFAGITTFPALLFDPDTSKVTPTHNLTTLENAAKALAASGRDNIEINSPGTTSSKVMAALASAGTTQIEPGHGLTGSTPLHAVQDLPEGPGMLYLSEVSHIYNGHPYCFGGGMYIDPVFPPYDVQALVGADPDAALDNDVKATLPPPSAIDYFGILDPNDGKPIRTGDTVIFGFRVQAFVTRAFVVPVSGISKGKATVEGVWTTLGQKTEWPA